MNQERNLSTADFAKAAEHREERREEMRADQRGDMRGEMRDERDKQRPPPADRVMPEPPEGEEAGMHAMARDIYETRKEGMHPAPAGAAMAQPHDAQGEQLAPLFLPQVAQNFRSQWDEVQIGFVDDPASAVRRADELVAQVMKNLAQTFADERSHMEGQLHDGDTEHMRVALRRYRSFFQRLLSL